MNATESSNHSSVDSFIVEVGRRVLEFRKGQGLSRRALSERSGVSQRTIVLLETGTGNISIGLLYKMAEGLGTSVEWLVRNNSQLGPDAIRVAEYFINSDTHQRQQVLNLLARSDSRIIKQQRICLLGLRGAGKSTLGKGLAESLGLPFVELNKEIELLSGLSVEEVMDLYGQEGFRTLERQAVDHIVESRDALVLAASGGIVSAADTHKRVCESFYTIWLKASPEEHMSRVVAQGDVRPIAGNPKAMQQLKNILTERESLYASADRTVDTSGATVAESQCALNATITELDIRI